MVAEQPLRVALEQPRVCGDARAYGGLLVGPPEQARVLELRQTQEYALPLEGTVFGRHGDAQAEYAPLVKNGRQRGMMLAARGQVNRELLAEDGLAEEV